MDDLPKPVPGPELRAARLTSGVSQHDLAAELGIHRTNLGKLERADLVDGIRAALYVKALATIARRKLGAA